MEKNKVARIGLPNPIKYDVTIIYKLNFPVAGLVPPNFTCVCVCVCVCVCARACVCVCVRVYMLNYNLILGLLELVSRLTPSYLPSAWSLYAPSCVWAAPFKNFESTSDSMFRLMFYQDRANLNFKIDTSCDFLAKPGVSLFIITG